MASTKSAGADQSSDGRLKTDSEFGDLLETALKGAKAGGVPRYIMSALRDAADAALNREVNQERNRALTYEWNPSAAQIWKRGMRTPDNKRLTAWAVYQASYGKMPKAELPFAHQVRQHPATKDLYDALCVFVSRNKSKGLKPDSIGDLFPVTDAARGGVLSRSKSST